MIPVVIAALLTVNTRNGTINYLFRKPQNGPAKIRYELIPSYATVSVYLLSKTIVQNVNIELSINNGSTNMVSLLYDSVNGVSFEFIRVQIDCPSCKRLSFAPALHAPMVGLFWSVFNISKMDYMYVPQMTTLKGCYFYVDQFLMEKGRFHTVIDNHVYSNNSAYSTRYASVGSHLDQGFAAYAAERCLSCNDLYFTLPSQCTCDSNGIMKGNACYTLINATELLTATTDKKVRYFLKCQQGRKSIIHVNNTITENEAIEYRTFLTADCDMSMMVLGGEITVKQQAAQSNYLFGISRTYSMGSQHLNISLVLKQVNDGMGSSSLMYYDMDSFSAIEDVRITGKLISQGQSSKDGFALVVITYYESGSIIQLGLFGAVLNVSSDNVGLLYSHVEGDGWGNVQYLYMAPSLPAEYYLLPKTQTSDLQLNADDFPCVGYANDIQVKSLKYAGYFTIINLIEQQLTPTLLIVRGNSSNVGGIYGRMDSMAGIAIQNCAIMLTIDNNGAPTSGSGIGLAFGSMSQNIQLTDAYIEGQITSQSNMVGLIGNYSTKNTGTSKINVAAKIAVSGTECVGFIGYLADTKGIISVTSIIDVTITCTSKCGVYGYISGMKITQNIIGAALQNERPANAIGKCGDNVLINSVKHPVEENVTEMRGTLLNTCSSDVKLPTVTVSELLEFTGSTMYGYYAAECQSSVIIDVQVNTQISGKRIVYVLKNDACEPTNLLIQGKLLIDTYVTTTTELYLAGYIAYPQMSITFINISIDIKHTGLNGTRMMSLFAINGADFYTAEFIRIFGTLQGDSKNDIQNGAYAAFFFCHVTGYQRLILRNAGLYGAQITAGGVFAAGCIAMLEGGAAADVQSLIITNKTGNTMLISQMLYDPFYYYTDACANKLTNQRNDSLNYEQYLKPFIEGRETAIFIILRKSQNVGLITGMIAIQGYEQANLKVYGTSVYGRIEVQTATNFVGILAGTVNGFLMANSLFVSGNMKVRSYAGMIGGLYSYGSLVAACRLNITGNGILGCFGHVANASSGVYIFFDINIQFDETKVGGFVGLMENSPWFSAYNLVCRSVLTGVGRDYDLLVGFADDVSKRNFYDGSLVNKC